MVNSQYSVLFLCTGNSARSILSESILNELGGGGFRGYSAGSKPLGRVNPFSIELLQSKGHDVSFARSKSWLEFEGLSAPKLDFVFTVCGNAADEECPYWPGSPPSAHWGVFDPAAVEGSTETRRRAFEKAYDILEARIRRFIGLPISRLSATELQTELDAIGEMDAKNPVLSSARTIRTIGVRHPKLCPKQME